MTHFNKQVFQLKIYKSKIIQLGTYLAHNKVWRFIRTTEQIFSLLISEFTLFHCLETKEASCGGVTVINAETTTLPSNNALQKCTLEKINFVPLSHPKVVLQISSQYG